MALFRKFFYRKPPEGLLEISDRVYVFDCCFTANLFERNEYEAYLGRILNQLHEYFPDASFMVFNFEDEENASQITDVLSEYVTTVIDYPSHYENCPLLTLEMIHHFLKSSESWLAIGQRNVLLMHCENRALPVLAFMLAALLIYLKQYTGEQRTLEMIYKQAPQQLLQLLLPLNPLPSQLRYLQYVSRRNIGSRWPPLDRALTLDCVNLRVIPDMDGEGGCRPLIRIYGQDPLMAADRTTKVLFCMPKRSKTVGYVKQADCELVKIDINCHVQGDVVLECITLDENLEHEEMMFRVMFNTAFIRSNILMLNRDEIDILWNARDHFPKDFRAEVLFSEMDSSSSLVGPDLPGIQDKEGLPIEAFAKVQDIFDNLDWQDSETDIAYNMIQQMTASSILQETLEIAASPCARKGNWQTVFSKSVKDEQLECIFLRNALQKKLETSSIQSETTSMTASPQSVQEQNFSSVCPDCNKEGRYESPKSEAFGNDTISSEKKPSAASKSSLDLTFMAKKTDPSELQVSVQRPAQSKIISPRISPTSHSISSQSSPVALSRYRSSPTGLGITTLLHDHAGFSADSSISASAPCASDPAPPPPPPPRPQSNSSSVSELPNTSFHPDISMSEEAGPSFRQQSSASSSPSSTPHPSSVTSKLPSAPDTLSASRPLHPPPLSAPAITPSPSSRIISSGAPPPPPLPPGAGTALLPSHAEVPPPSAPQCPGSTTVSTSGRSAPPPPPPPCPPTSGCSAPPPPPPPCPPSSIPPPPAPNLNSLSKTGGASLQHSSVSNGNIPPPPLGAKGKLQPRMNSRIQGQSKKSSLKPYHWLKLTRAIQGSLWAEAQKPEEASKAPELDISELETLFAANVPKSDHGTKGKTNKRGSVLKSDKVQLIELRRAYNCEIMLTKVKVPLPDLVNSILALDDSALDVDQVDNLIKFCPTKEEMELLKNYKGDKENLGKCEQFFLELMKVPRVESKLRVFSFRIQFSSQVSDLRNSLNTVNSTSEEVRTSVKLKRIMQTILSLGNALNHGTARGSAVGFRLDSLLKLTETRARNNKLTLMHYLCKVLAEKLPEVLDFHKDLVSLEAATKIQLKYLAEEMQAVSKGTEKVVQELTMSEHDGAVSESFCKILKEFYGSAEEEVKSVASLYSGVGRNADALALYFGEDPARCPFEQVVSTLLNFVRMFQRCHEENCKQQELEKKKAQNEAENGKGEKLDASRKELENENVMTSAVKVSELQSQQ
ncbi:Formin-like protein 18 [Sesamum alatum]|uniref:Formin-like protein n=1 Tax=Sesamum alatum TaxID=300844 RepID=A0AAE2CVL3_9LAMI|nr:Formin-like protein 18 [Sesamum alatum]